MIKQDFYSFLVYLTPISVQDRISPCNISTIPSTQVIKKKREKYQKGEY